MPTYIGSHHQNLCWCCDLSLGLARLITCNCISSFWWYYEPNTKGRGCPLQLATCHEDTTAEFYVLLVVSSPCALLLVRVRCAHPVHYFPAPAVCACRALPRGIRVPRIPRPGLAAARRGIVPWLDLSFGIPEMTVPEAVFSKRFRLSPDSPRRCVYGYVNKYSRPKKLGCACFVGVQPPVKLQFLPLPFWGTTF